MAEQLATVTASREELARDYSNAQAALKQQTAATREAKAALELALERARMLEEREAQVWCLPFVLIRQGLKGEETFITEEGLRRGLGVCKKSPVTRGKIP